jgi:DNA-binding MarR family transcriptional regulator
MTLREIRQFRRVLRRFERLTHSQLKSCCARVTLAQCLVLLEIEEHRRPTTGRLASELRLDSSTLSRTIDGLVRRGLVERARADRDRRVVWLKLTAEGRAVCRAIHNENDTYYRRVFKKIPPTRQKTVTRNFEILVRALLDCEAEARPGACRDPALRTTRT